MLAWAPLALSFFKVVLATPKMRGTVEEINIPVIGLDSGRVMEKISGAIAENDSVMLVDEIGSTATMYNNIIPLSIGPDFISAYSDRNILQGFKSNIADGENPMKGAVFKGTIDTIRFENSYSENFIIKNDNEFNKMMEIEGSLGISYGPISASGAGSYLQARVLSKRQATLTYRARKAAYARQVDISTLKPVDSELEKLSADDIADRYGTKFINSVIYGAQLDVIFTVTSVKDIDIKEIEAELKGKFGFGALLV